MPNPLARGMAQENRCIVNHGLQPGEETKSLRASPPRLSMGDPALKILSEVHRSKPVNPLEDSGDPEKRHDFQSPGGALEQF
jgi:hypothetical protein